MTYTTISKVRELSGLDNTTNIPQAVIVGKIADATAMFESAIGSRYTLPLKYHRSNTLTFTGTGTGTGTMTITINGVNYTVAVTSGLTAAQAADLFRAAAVSSAHFITLLNDDADAEGTIVTIISRTDSTTFATANAEVNITSAGGTVQGITGTAGARADRYPPMADQITAEIAASLLLLDNYGAEAEDTPKDGDKRMQRINQKLLQLQGEAPDLPDLKMLDEVTKAELSTSSGEDPLFYPTSTSETDTDDPTDSKIEINKDF